MWVFLKIDIHLYIKNIGFHEMIKLREVGCEADAGEGLRKCTSYGTWLVLLQSFRNSSALWKKMNGSVTNGIF